MGYFSNPSVVIKMSEERLTAVRKVLKWLSNSDDRAVDTLNAVLQRQSVKKNKSSVGNIFRGLFLYQKSKEKSL